MQFCARAYQLHHVEPHQADLDHIARHACHRDAIAHAHTVSSDDEKVCSDRQQNALQTHRDAGRDKACKGSQGTELRDKPEDHYQPAQEADHRPPHKQELPPSSQIPHVLERGVRPKPAHQAQDAQCQRNRSDTKQERSQENVILRFHGAAPCRQRPTRVFEQHHLLAQGQCGVCEHLKGVGQGVELLACSRQILRATLRCCLEVDRLLHQAIALRRRGTEHP